jgi:hypothetical protein
MQPKLTSQRGHTLIYGGAEYVEDNSKNRSDIFEVYYERPRNAAPAVGSIYFKINPNGKILQKSAHPFSAPDLAFFMTNLPIIGSDHFYRLRILDVFPQQDGSTVIRVEKKFYHLVNLSYYIPYHEDVCGCTSSRAGYTEKRGPIIAVKFDPDGKFIQETLIKKQSVSTSNFATFSESFFEANDQFTYWIYPAKESEVINPPKDINGLNYCEFSKITPDKPSAKDECIAVTVINTDNSVKTSVLLSNNKSRMHVYLGIYAQLTSDTYVFAGGYSSNQYGLIKIQFKP